MRHVLRASSNVCKHWLRLLLHYVHIHWHMIMRILYSYTTILVYFQVSHPSSHVPIWPSHWWTKPPLSSHIPSTMVSLYLRTLPLTLWWPLVWKLAPCYRRMCITQSNTEMNSTSSISTSIKVIMPFFEFFVFCFFLYIFGYSLMFHHHH